MAAPVAVDPPAPQWMEFEFAEQAAEEVLDEIFTKGALILYDKYIEEKLCPYAVARSIGVAFDVAEIAFLRHDIGESEQKSSLWIQEEEFMPSRIDTWARGAVPIKKKIRQPTSSEATFKFEAGPRTVKSSGSSTSRLERRKQNAAEPSKQQGKDAVKKVKAIPIISESTVESINDDEDKLREMKDRELKRRREEEARQAKKKAEEEADKLKLAKMQTDLRLKEFTYDHNGNVLFIQPVNVDKLPPSNYNVNFDLKSESESVDDKKRKGNGVKSKPAVGKKPVATSKTAADVEFVKASNSAQPPVWDTMKVSPGVKLTENGRSKAGPKKVSDASHISRRDYTSMVDSQIMSTHSFGRSLQPVMEASFSPLQQSVNSHTDQRISSLEPIQPSPRLPLLVDETPLATPLNQNHPPPQYFADTTVSETVVRANGHQQSAMEEFNNSILNSADWGVNPPPRAFTPLAAPPKATPKQKELTLGTVSRMPRDRPFENTSPKKRHLPAPPLGATMGHGPVSLPNDRLPAVGNLTQKSFRSESPGIGSFSPTKPSLDSPRAMPEALASSEFIGSELNHTPRSFARSFIKSKPVSAVKTVNPQLAARLFS
eukprot:GILJ01002983.1.p1 GENE.GILJ01002983.1~~GILJ01002983.1.p1  ORF type:complete len:601 (+),score=117.23 GILJ01002983.1:80-1882(+)